MASKKLNERAKNLLKLLIQEYIHHGEPVGSHVLAKTGTLSLSPATIRNVMADLELAGYLKSPHTSAGRIPTDKGYRFFVDSLLTSDSKSKTDNTLKLEIKPNEDTASLLKTTGNLLSEVTKLVAFVSLPKRSRVCLQHIEFLSLSERRILIILIFDDREVHNRIITTDRSFTSSELLQASNFLNEQYVGKNLSTIRRILFKALKQDQREMNHLMKAAIKMAAEAFQQSSMEEETYLMTGQSNLIELAQVSEIEKIKSLFEAFSQKQTLLYLIDRCLGTVDTQIYIGKEAGIEVFKESSIVTTPYQFNGEILGVLGVIGPTRIPYDHVISVVTMTARLLNSAFNRS